MMAYNYSKEKKLWLEWKEKEEKEMRSIGVPEKVIQELREYDQALFNQDRRFRQHQYMTEETFFMNQQSNDTRDVQTLEDVLDELENEALCELINIADSLTYKIIDLKFQGYTVKEISEKLGVSIFIIYNKIKKFKKNFKNL